MSSGLLYRAIFVLVHCVFTVFTVVYGALERITTLIVDFCHEFCTPQRTSYLKNEIRRRNKLPKHLTLLLENEEPSYKDLANFVVWCLDNRIPFLSFYDKTGALKKHQEKLEKEINKKLPPNDHIIWHNIPGSTYKNGFVGRKIHFKILTETDGRGAVKKLTQNLYTFPIKSEISIESIDNLLYKNFEFPDPDLGLYCGPTLNLYRYPPWQIRITEFLSIKTHRISYKRFLEQLYVYSMCEQRLGK